MSTGMGLEPGVLPALGCPSQGWIPRLPLGFSRSGISVTRTGRMGLWGIWGRAGSGGGKGWEGDNAVLVLSPTAGKAQIWGAVGSRRGQREGMGMLWSGRLATRPPRLPQPSHN